MSGIHYNAVDLNLLRLLSVLAEERSVTRAGDRLGLTQSAVSHALARLRAIFGDPLFVRGPRGMQPTQRALELAAGVQAGLSQIESALSPKFDSATTDRRFTVVGGSYVCMVLAPALMERMAAQAPHAELHMRNYANDMYALLDTGQADAMLAGFMTPPDRFATTPLFQDQFVWVVRAGHDILKDGASVEKLAALRFVAIDLPVRPADETSAAPVSGVWYDRGAFDAELSRRDLVQRVGAVAPDSLSAMAMVARSDMATLAPRRLVQSYLDNKRFALIEPPYPSPSLTLSAIHRRDSANDPACSWLLAMLREAASALD
jgi:DNA-binding transcriptional LysR family regulator